MIRKRARDVLEEDTNTRRIAQLNPVERPQLDERGRVLGKTPA